MALRLCVKRFCSLQDFLTASGATYAAWGVAFPRPPDCRNIYQQVQCATRHDPCRRSAQNSSTQRHPQERDQEIEDRAEKANPLPEEKDMVKHAMSQL